MSRLPDAPVGAVPEAGDTAPLSRAVVSEGRRARPRLEFLDGLRGVAALYVMMDHLTAAYIARLPVGLQRATGWMTQGHYAVNVFIVLSGYCLMLPVAAAGTGQLKGGFGAYIQRRARRILPPYYAAIVVSLLVLILTRGTDIGKMRAFAPDVLVSHLLLIHNLRSQWVFQIEAPLWSVATEWQIYFLMPLILLPVYRRYGKAALLLVGFAVGMAPHLLLPRSSNLDWAYPWFVGLFAMGMVGAVIGFTDRPQEQRLRAMNLWGWLCIGCTVLFALPDILPHLPRALNRLLQVPWVRDALVGGAAAALIIACARHLRERAAEPTPPILSLLQSRPVLALGAFSYSLYLVHVPVQEVVIWAVAKQHLTPTLSYAAAVVIGVPLVLAAAYAFHLAFERRFMSSHSR